MQAVVGHPLANKTTRALATLLALLALPYATPRFRVLRVAHAPGARDEESAITGRSEGYPAQPIAVGDQKLQATENQGGITNALPATHAKEAPDPDALAKTNGTIAIEDPALERGGHALDPFYASARPHAQTERRTPASRAR